MNRSSGDEFSRISDKMALLFDLTPQSRVLVVGPYGGHHEKDFRKSFRNCDFAERVEVVGIEASRRRTGYDLIILDTRDASPVLDLSWTIGNLRNSFNPDGQLVVIGKNRYSPKRLARMSPFERYGVSTYSLSPEATKRDLRAWGFQSVLGFLVLPDVENMEECASDEDSIYEIPGHYHPILHLLNAIGAYRYVHDDYLLMACVSEWSGMRRFLSWLREYLVGSANGRGSLRLKRFDPRRRGVLALFLEDIRGGRSLIARVAGSEVVGKQFQKSMYWTRRIRSADSLSGNLKARVPKTVATLRYKDSAVHVEEMLDGIVAWKLVRDPSVKKSIDAGARRFLDEIAHASVREIYVSESMFRSLIEEDIHRVGDALESWPRLKTCMDEITDVLKRNILGREIQCVWAHGDFGYGNILADKASGAITGVIDWDEAREAELGGVDWINFRIQEYRTAPPGPFSSAIKRVTEELCSRQTGKQEGSGFVRPGTVLAVAWLRYVVRAAQYPGVLAEEVDEFIRGGEVVNSFLGRGSGLVVQS